MLTRVGDRQQHADLSVRNAHHRRFSVHRRGLQRFAERRVRVRAVFQPSPAGRSGIIAAAVKGLASGHPTLSFKLTAGKNAKLKSFTVKLPRGSELVRHRATDA